MLPKVLENHPSRLLTIGQTAEFLGVTPRTVRRQFQAGILPAPIRLTERASLRWRLADLVAVIEAAAPRDVR